MSDQERSAVVVGVGWFLCFALYIVQFVIFSVLLSKHHNTASLVTCIVLYLIPILTVIVPMIFILRKDKSLYAEEDEHIRYIWVVWGIYILAFTVTVAMIFCKVAEELTKEVDLGINTLKGTLCLAPILLILLLQLTISPLYRKPVLSLSIFSALNIFDGIEMLEVVLMQNYGNIDLNIGLENSIIAFACISFLISPLGLVRNQFCPDGEVKERKRTSTILGPLEIIGSNLPFLVLRAIIWYQHKYEASVFIAKNIISLFVGLVEFCILKDYIKWGTKDS